VEAYYKAQGLFHTAECAGGGVLGDAELDLSTVEPSVAGPKRPQDRVLLSKTPESFAKQLPALQGPNANKGVVRQMVRWEGEGGHASLSGGNLASSKGGAGDGVQTTVARRRRQSRS
jgi:aconitate hydratase